MPDNAEVNAVKILDLDEFVPKDKFIKINKKEYRIKGNASLKMTLSLMASAEKWRTSTSDPESIRELLRSVKMFFIDGIDDEVLESLDPVGQLPKLIAFLYGIDPKAATEKNGPSRAE